MKKLLIAIVVLFVISTGFCTIIDVVLDGVGDLGHTGTAFDPLVAGEEIWVKLILNHVPGSYPSGDYPSYDGYVLSGMSLELATTNATVGFSTNAKNRFLGYDPTQWTFPPAPEVLGTSILTHQAGGRMVRGVVHPDDADGTPLDLVWDLYVVADGNGDIVITPTNADPGGMYADFRGETWNTTPWVDLQDSDLGGLTIYTSSVNPEPMTMTLLAVGGLLIRRRK